MSLIALFKQHVYHVILRTLYYLSFTHIKTRIRIQGLKNKYNGKRCFVVCNGPSLRAEDLTRIHEAGDCSIAMNFIANVYPQTPWRPDVLVCTDGCVFEKKGRDVVKNCEAGMKVFQKKDFLRAIDYKGPKLYVTIDGSEELLDSPKFSEQLDQIIYAIGTTAYECLEWARWLGCKEIYVVGCDMSYAVNANRDGSIYYNNTGENHFYSQEKDVVSKVKPVQTWQQKLAHQAADQYSRSHGFRIFNATRGGFLEEYERVDIDTLF